MNKYYVYWHRHPITKKVFYVGYGSSHRAWVFNSIVFRQEAHHNYLKVLEKDGWLPGDWVFIAYRGLSKQQAMEKEKEEIRYFNPKFNIHKGLGSLTDKTKIKLARKLRNKGLSFSQIAKQMKAKSAMTAWRYVNNDQ